MKRFKKRMLFLPSTGGAPPTYTQKVIALSPIAYWPFADASGATATDESGNARNGAYTTVTLGATGIGDGRTAASLNGSTSVINLYSAGLAGAFNGQECTISGWFKVSAAGDWTDGTRRDSATFFVDGSNFFIIRKALVDNQVEFAYTAGGSSFTAVMNPLSSTAWVHFAATVTKSGNAGKLWINGTQQNTTKAVAGTFAGSLSSTFTVAGATNTSAANPWKGSLAHFAVFTSALSGATIATLATV